MPDIRLKLQNVNNPENVLLQIPKFISELWELKKNDKLEVILSDDSKSLVVRKLEDDAKDIIPTT